MNSRLADFHILVSTRMENGRHWEPDWRDLPVRLQRNLAIRGSWKHPHHFSEPLTVQIPYDTLPQLMRLKPDVVISYEMGARTAQAVAYRRLHSRTRLIIWATISDVTEQGRGRLRHWLRALLLKHADAVIVSGQSGARYIRRFGVEPSRVSIVPFTTGLAPFLAIPESRTADVRKRLLYVGSLTERKGLMQFLSVLADWARRNPERPVEFLALGDGPLRPSLAAFPAPPNLTVRLLGHLPYEKLSRAYSEGGIFVFPTLADDWGLVVTEAMASGLPVFGSIYSQAVEELVKDGESGWTFRPDERAEVASKLNLALATPSERLNAMGAIARHSVRNISPASVANQVLQTAKNVYGARSPQT